MDPLPHPPPFRPTGSRENKFDVGRNGAQAGQGGGDPLTQLTYDFINIGITSCANSRAPSVRGKSAKRRMKCWTPTSVKRRNCAATSLGDPTMDSPGLWNGLAFAKRSASAVVGATATHSELQVLTMRL